jgi:hypothetical protein
MTHSARHLTGSRHRATIKGTQGCPEIAVPRVALGSVVVVAVALILAVLGVALLTGPAPQPAGQLVAGRVTGPGGRPVSGIKVWLNAWPNAAVVKALSRDGRPVPVTVTGSATTSATGKYAIRVLAPAALAPNATNGIIKFQVMSGDSAGWDTSSFSGRLVQTIAGTALALPSGSGTTDLHLMPH